MVGPNSFNNLQNAGQICGLLMKPDSSKTCALIRTQSRVILTIHIKNLHTNYQPS